MILVDELLTRAIVVWTGWGRSPSPARNEDAVLAAFGSEQGLDLLPRVRALEDEFYDSNASNEAPDLVTMGMQAAAEFSEKHPEVGEEGVRAFAWCYTYDFK